MSAVGVSGGELCVVGPPYVERRPRSSKDREAGQRTGASKQPTHDTSDLVSGRGKSFLEGGYTQVNDFELLCLLLGELDGYRDVERVAEVLLNKFRTFAQILAASVPDLRRIGHLADKDILKLKVSHRTAVHLLQNDLLGFPLLRNWEDLFDYLTATMSRNNREQYRVLYLDRRSYLLGDEQQALGSIEYASLYIREIARSALELNATHIVAIRASTLGHEASRGDLSIVDALKKGLFALRINVRDYIIVSRDGITSFMKSGLC